MKTIQHLYMQNPSYFSPAVIRCIEFLAKTKKFNLAQFANVAKLLQLNLFKNVIESTCHSEENEINIRILKDYLRAICFYRHLPLGSVHYSVLFWLCAKFEQPVSFNMTPSQCRVTVKSTYRPTEGANVTADVLSRCTEQMESLRNSDVINYTYTPKTCQVENLPNNIINGVVSNLLNLQTVMNREAQSQNLKLNPFLDIVNDKIGLV